MTRASIWKTDSPLFPFSPALGFRGWNRFGLLEPGALAGFDEEDCLRVAYDLRLPLRGDGSLCLPFDVRAANPIADSACLVSGVAYRLCRDKLSSEQ